MGRPVLLLFSTLWSVYGAAHAAPQDFIGNFKGDEKITISGCRGWNGTSTSPWSATITDLNGNAFQGNGTNQQGGFALAGTVTSPNAASGTLKGINNWGRAWNGTFSATLDADKLMVVTKTVVPSSGCSVDSTLEASRH
jgi:hypothetical protein